MKFRSGYEERIFADLTEKGLTAKFEPFKLSYLLEGKYLPDFELPNGILVEAKGYFDSRSRAKMLAVKRHNPQLDIRMVFMNSSTKVRKGSDMTYADWCNRYGFKFADGMIPDEWFNEKSRF